MNYPASARYATMNSPVGRLFLVASDKGLHAILWQDEVPALKKDPNHPVLKKTIQQLTEYFACQRQAFDLPLAPEGTPFQQKAWRELSKIPYGQTISYGEQAKRVGNKKAQRAVGTANSKNPLSIVVPCHRVIAADGTLGGFGGGLKAKQILLKLERDAGVH